MYMVIFVNIFINKIDQRKTHSMTKLIWYSLLSVEGKNFGIDQERE